MPARRPVRRWSGSRGAKRVAILAAAVRRVGFGPLGIAGGWNVASGNAVEPQSLLSHIFSTTAASAGLGSPVARGS